MHGACLSRMRDCALHAELECFAHEAGSVWEAGSQAAVCASVKSVRMYH